MKLDLNKLNLNENDTIIVGVSSGPDSMALLHYLHTHEKCNIVCAHINHNVRKQSKKEENFLQKYCQLNNITFESIKITTYTENNFENEARKKRYKFYLDLLKKYNSKYLFLAHHGDDLIETVLMKIARGSNLEGYAGIKEISIFKDKYFIIRPLLKYTKKDIINYLKLNKVKFFIDKSNKNTKYTRNRYRKYVLPFLKKEDPNIHKKFLKFSKVLKEYDDYIKKETKDITNKIYNNNYLNLNEFNKIDNFMKKNMLYYILNNVYDNTTNIIKETHINNILKLIDSNNTNATLNLPQNIVIKKEYTRLIFKSDVINDQKQFNFKLKKHNSINNYIIDIISNTEEDSNNICRLDSSELSLPLYIRNKNDGDTIEVLGLNGKKKIKNIFIENKIPTNKRIDYPILVDSNDQILWVPNLKKSKFNKKKYEKYDIILRYYERKDDMNE